MKSPHRAAELPPSCPFDPDQAATVSDPYPGYRWLREQAPVSYLANHDLWVVSRYADVVEVLSDPYRFSSQLGMGAVQSLHAPQSVDYRIGAPGVRVLIATDPPEHSRLRRAVLAPFGRSAIARLTPRIERVAADLVADLVANAERGDAEIYRDLAAPLPVLVLAELLGVPTGMRDEFREWASVITDDLDANGATDTRLGRGYDMFRYFYTEIRRRKHEPSDDLLSVVAATDAAGLSDREVMAFCAFLLVAGVETTTNLFTNLIDTLVRRPEVRRRLWAAPELAEPVVEEALRYDTSVQGLWRATVADDRLGGVDLPAGARLLVLFGSANRDDETFADADAFDLERSPNPHLAFGYGHHRCLGAGLAKVELVAALRALVTATGGLAPRGKFVRRDSLVLRGFSAQPVTVWPR
ncbi:cytochrome P450 [Actinoplanes nipponensis]|uniref:cytochrome P450 n=1 Tax=Actinoplanes nipponensis TaxID=135950 RepID=UPI0019431E2E|nr:cytochrome P450 [Actinoplanes nipponensis]